MIYTVTVTRSDGSVVKAEEVNTDKYNLLSASCYVTLRDRMGFIAGAIFNDASERIGRLG